MTFGSSDAGNHFDVTAVPPVFADFNINIEDSLEALHPGHGADGRSQDSCHAS
ncbi:hypothetical protein J0X08_05270 (plasmid) [Klebsiella variicola]|nr:hypothetical protein [Klebsiella variicola]